MRIQQLPTPQLGGPANSGSVSMTPALGKGPTGATGPAGPAGPTGAPGGSDGSFAGWINDTASATRAALNSSYAPLDEPFELVPYSIYGDSYGYNNTGSQAADVGTLFGDRIGRRLRTQTPTNMAVPSTRADEIATRALANWVPDSRGMVLLADCVLNDVQQLTTGQTSTTAEAFRTFWATIFSRSKQDITGASFQFGPGWTAGAGTSGKYVDFSFVGDSVWVGCQFVTTAGGTLTITDASGATVTSIVTGGFGKNFVGVTRLSGFGAGNHTLRGTVATGTVTLANLLIPAPNPPLGVWVKPGPVPVFTSAQNAATKSFLAACEAVRAAQFPAVRVVDLDVTGYDQNAMTGPDQIHLNDRGNVFATQRILANLRAVDYTQGLNRLTAANSGVYIAPTPSFVGSSAAVPAAPTGVAGVTGNQVNVTWARSTDGGATITSQVIQRSSDGGTTWADVLTGIAPTAEAAAISSGLTEGTSYLLRVLAVNAIGRGTPSAASAAVTAGALPTTYSADTFTRADSSSLGSTETGGLPWQTIATTGTWAIASNQLTYTATGTGNPPDCYIDDTHADGTFSLTLRTASSTQVGLLTRGAGTNNATGYVFYRTTTGYIFAKRNSAVSYTTLKTITMAINGGDVLTVVWNGASYTLKVNGVIKDSGTDASYTGTRHGVWSGAAGQSFDDFIHTSVIGV